MVLCFYVPCISPRTHAQISSRERHLIAIFYKLTMPSDGEVRVLDIAPCLSIPWCNVWMREPLTTSNACAAQRTYSCWARFC